MMRLHRIFAALTFSVLLPLAAHAQSMMGIINQDAPLNPVQIFGSSLKGWYKFDNPANTVISGAFSVVQDLSGNGFDLHGGTSNPSVAAAQINGLTCGEFIPANLTFMNTGANDRPGIADVPFYVFGIIKPRANVTTGANRRWLSGAVNPVVYTTDNSVHVTLNSFNSTAGPSVVGPGNSQVYAFTARFVGTKQVIRLNALAPVEALSADSGGWAQLFVGSGGGFGANDSADGWALEIGIVGRDVTANEDNEIIAYLANRAGL